MIGGKRRRRATAEEVARQCRQRLVATNLSDVQRSPSDRGFNLHSVIRAAVAQVTTTIGAVNVGLSAFTLVLDISNGRVEPNSDLDSSLPERLVVKREELAAEQHSRKSSLKFGAGAKVGIALSPVPVDASVGGRLSGGREVSEKSSSSSKGRVSLEIRAVKVVASRPNGLDLAIENTAAPGEPINQKVYTGVACYVTPVDQASDVRIDQSVKVSSRQIVVGGGTGVFREDVPKERKKIRDLLVAELVEKEWDLQPVIIRDEK